MTNVHRIGQRLIRLLCLALGMGVSSTAVARDDVTPEVKASQAELEKAIEAELAKAPEIQDVQAGKRVVLTAIIGTALAKTAVEAGLKLIKNKFPNLKPSTDDMQFVNDVASNVVTKVVNKVAPLAGLHPKLKDTNLLSGLLTGLLKNSNANLADDFVTEALAKLPGFLGIDALSKDDRSEITDKAKAVFQNKADTTQPAASSDSILGDEAVKNKIIARLRSIDAELTEAQVLNDGKPVSDADRISNLKKAISATRNNMFDKFLSDVTNKKITKFADLSATDQKEINEVLIPEVVQRPAEAPGPGPGDDQEPPAAKPPAKPPTRIRKKPTTSSVGSSTGGLSSLNLGNAVLVPKCRLFRGLSSRRGVLLQDSGSSRSVSSRYVIIED